MGHLSLLTSNTARKVPRTYWYLLSTAFRKSLSGSRLKRATCIGPAKGLGHAIEVLDKSQDLRPQIILGCEVAALDHPPHQDAEPDFDLIEPRRMLGYIHELNTVRRVTQKGRPTGHRLQHAAFAFQAQSTLRSHCAA